MTSQPKPPPPPPDMSTKIGNRVVKPAYPVVDSTLPTEEELAFQATLEKYMAENIPTESVEGIQARERVLSQLGVICRQWIQHVCRKKNFSQEIATNAGGQLFTSGSYRLGVHEPGADIDTILVAPNMCTREDFFGTNYQVNTSSDDNQQQQVRDPESLAERIRRHKDVTNFVPVESAAIPILTFDWYGINIDLLFARLTTNTIPNNLSIDNDTVLDGVDTATEKSLNGPRVTNLIAALVVGNPDAAAAAAATNNSNNTINRYQTFLTVVRCVRKWAKARGLYSNKMGYWGGVNINIAVTLTIQLYPHACAASILRKFFLVFKTWRWPQPVMLTKPYDAGYGLTVWSPTLTRQQQVAPMITPAYPAMNSTLSISRQTLQIMQEEFNRGHEIVDTVLWKTFQQRDMQDSDDSDNEVDWSQFFEPSDFFINYPHYLSVCIVGPTQADAQAWVGFVESRLRKLVAENLGRSLPLKKIQLWPKKLDACICDKSTALLTPAQRQNSTTYFIGIHVDILRMRGESLNVESALRNFQQYELTRFQPLITGMDVLVKVFRVKELPQICFVGIYPGGKQEAMQKRRQRMNDDPVRQEKKRQLKLLELKAKMAEIQQRKEQKQAEEAEAEAGDDDDEKSRKRKREANDNGSGDENDDEEKQENVVKEEDGGGEPPAAETTVTSTSITATTANTIENNEETNLLESALDTIQQDTGEGYTKTREQAEADRQKLLAGELGVASADDGEAAASAADRGADDNYEDEAELYTGARQSFYGTMNRHTEQLNRDKRSLPVGEDEAEILKKLGYSIVTDDESKMLDAAPDYSAIADAEMDQIRSVKIHFLQPFNMIKLDALGRVIDTGDDDYTPSAAWQGRKAGFEFKLGERGLGYYRTGKKVVIPSNTQYH